MKCPHCLTEYHAQVIQTNLGAIGKFGWTVIHQPCPSCNEPIIRLIWHRNDGNREFMAYPKGVSRAPVPREVPPQFADDYKEACLVFADSAKASAALSRRCLQNILRDVAGVKKQDLSKEIDEVMPKLPSHLAEAIDAVRNLGNFAAHPMKSTNTGAILDVEPGEAEWLLDVLEGMFDFYFVQPALLKSKRAALNQKLQEAGKPPMK